MSGLSLCVAFFYGICESPNASLQQGAKMGTEKFTSLEGGNPVMKNRETCVKRTPLAPSSISSRLTQGARSKQVLI